MKGEKYRRVNLPGAGHPRSARTRSSTARYDIYFDAVRKRASESLVPAWRESSPDRAKNALIAYCRRRGYEIEIDNIKFIEGSVK